MGIDTSSYYPEVPSQNSDGYSLNSRSGGLFGEPEKPSEDPEKPSDDTGKTDGSEQNGKNRAENSDKESSPNGGSSRQDASPDEEKESSEEVSVIKYTDNTPMEKGATLVSNLLSWILVPLLMPVYGLMLAFGLSILDVAPFGMRLTFTLIVAGICVVVPMVLIILLKMFGLIQDVGLNGRKERLIPYIITAVCFAATGWFMAAKGAPSWLYLFFFGGAAATVVNTVINFWWKISAHAAGIAGVVALLIRIEKEGSSQPELFFWLILTIGLAGLLGSARVWLGRHTTWQVLAGYVVGFCCVFFLS